MSYGDIVSIRLYKTNTFLYDGFQTNSSSDIFSVSHRAVVFFNKTFFFFYVLRPLRSNFALQRKRQFVNFSVLLKTEKCFTIRIIKHPIQLEPK